MKSWLNDNDAKTYSTHKQGKFVAEEWFIGTLNNKFTNIWQQTSIKVYINKPPEIVDEYNNTTFRNIKLKPVDVKRNTYISFDVQFNGKNTKFNVYDHARISKYKNTFTKDYQPQLKSRSVCH